MNEKIFDTAAAMTGMDDALVSEAAKAGKAKRTGLKWIAAAAAALVLAVGTAIVLPKLIKPKTNDISALVPTYAPLPEGGEDEPYPTENDNYGGAEATSEPIHVTAEPAATPQATSIPVSTMSFDSVGALNMAVCSAMSGGINGPVEGLNSIYMPTKVPYGAELEDITVDADSVVITYGINEEWIVEEDDPNRFVLVWFREWQQGAAEELARSLVEEVRGSELHCADGTWIFSGEGCLERVAVWEEDGFGFEIITPGVYCEDSDTLSFTGLAKVALGSVDAHIPSEGFVIDGYMWLSENGMGCAPLTSFAYGRTYGDGVMVQTRGRDFTDCITGDMRTFEGLMKAFPHVGMLFEPVLLENTEIETIDVYDVHTLEPIAPGITMDELMDIARLSVGEELADRIAGECSGCVLVDITVVRRGNYIAELDEYECEAFHCGFILECGC